MVEVVEVILELVVTVDRVVVVVTIPVVAHKQEELLPLLIKDLLEEQDFEVEVTMVEVAVVVPVVLVVLLHPLLVILVLQVVMVV